MSVAVASWDILIRQALYIYSIFCCRDGSTPGSAGTQGQGKSQTKLRTAWPHILCDMLGAGSETGGGRKLLFPLGSELEEQQEPPDLAQN